MIPPPPVGSVSRAAEALHQLHAQHHTDLPLGKLWFTIAKHQPVVFSGPCEYDGLYIEMFRRVYRPSWLHSWLQRRVIRDAGTDYPVCCRLMSPLTARDGAMTRLIVPTVTT